MHAPPPPPPPPPPGFSQAGPAASQGVAARLRGVSKRFADVQALHQIDLELPRGTVGLLGPNGAGKSTLFRLMLGLERPDQGTVEVLDRPMPDNALEVLARIGYMPEDDSLFPNMHGYAQVVHAAQLSGLSAVDARSRAHQALDLCGLADARYRMASGFSLGMRQRLRLAMAVVHGPELLILDEPTAGLDPEGRGQMLDLIREIGRQGVAVLLSTHVLPDIEAVCDHVVLLSKGQLGYCGTLHGFRADSGSRWRVRVVGEAALLQSACLSVGMHADLDGRDVLIAAPEEALGEIWRLCAEVGVGVRRFGPLEEDMGTAFVRHLRIDDPLRRLDSAQRPSAAISRGAA